MNLHEKSILSSHRTITKEPVKVYKEDMEVPKDLYYVERVLDWEKRIANYSPALKNKYREALKKKDEFFALITEDKSNGWSLMTDNKKKGLYAETKTSERGLPIIRAKSYSNHDPLTTYRLAGCCDMRSKYDKNIDYVKVINKLGVNLLVGYQRTLRILTVAPRDLYQEGICNCEADGTLWSVLYDTTGEEYPVEKGIVRMASPLAGFKFTPYPDDPTKCSVDLVIEADIGGNIPNWVFKQVLGETAYGLVLVRELLPDWVKKNKK